MSTRSQNWCDAEFGMSCEPAFTDILRAWHDVQSEYLDCFKWDVPWWYNEQASVSLLAAAVARVGGIVLAEFAWQKTTKKVSRELTKKGRCDLFFTAGCPQETSLHFWCEAKTERTKVDLYKRGGVKGKKMLGGLVTATRETNRLEDVVGTKLALLFLTPHIEAKDLRDKRLPTSLQIASVVAEIVANMRKEAREAEDICAVAWYFAPLKSGSCAEYEKHYYPGNILVMKRA